MQKEYDFFELYAKFLNATLKGKRKGKNGKPLKQSSAQNYIYLQKMLVNFCATTGFKLKIRSSTSHNKREFMAAKKYWQRFYRQFTIYLFQSCSYTDNYVSTSIRLLRAFFNWIKTETAINPGEYYKHFYANRDEIPIFTLSQSQLQFLIFDKEFESQLSNPLKRIKDIFVVGCTTALRYSDLIALRQSNLQVFNGAVFLKTSSAKTSYNTSIKLPQYCIDIIAKYKFRNKQLLPVISLANFNVNLKKLFEKAGWTSEVEKVRTRKGIKYTIKNNRTADKRFRFCDMASSHMMRRTAITTMLSSGVSELAVKRISGHSDSSHSFYRYVNYVQEMMDDEVEKAYKKIYSYIDNKEDKPESGFF